ncbi:MAG: hypothetical protein HFH85_20755 [Lachnospiraceae bacterium]|jgi:hypothetical protein|nr:hypothetical protein [Lachnospiraceae bacterium]HBA50750.1 hypothetical protein [Lachnospiraceae bacterium]
MKLVVDNREFAECMKKILPAVEVARDKKETSEGSVSLMVTNRKVGEDYFGIAVAYDGKKQMFCIFRATELEMESEKEEIYVSGKRLCEICTAMDNGKDVPMSIEVDKYCLVKKGGSQVQLPLGERPVIISPSDDWYIRTKVSTSELAGLLTKGGRFYRAGADNSTADVCISFDLEKGKIQASSTDVYKLGMVGIDAKLEEGDKLKQLKEAMQKEEGEVPPAFNLTESRIKVQIEGEQLKTLSRFMDMRADKTEILVFEKYVYFKTGADIALYMLKDVSEKPYAFEGALAMAKSHSRKGSMHMAPRDIMDALAVFDVANQDEEPHVYIKKDKSGAVSFSTKGKVSKTLVACEAKDAVNDMILNSKIFRQVVSCYDKEEKITIMTGDAQEPVIIMDKDGSEDFCIISKIEK